MPSDTYRRYIFMNAFGEEPRPEVMAGSFPLEVGTITADGTFTEDEDCGPILKVEMAVSVSSCGARLPPPPQTSVLVSRIHFPHFFIFSKHRWRAST